MPMRMLLLTHRLPYPPNRGDRIRSFHLLKFLAARGEVSLACTTEEAIPDDTIPTLSEYCSQIEICPISVVGKSGRAVGSLAVGRSATEGYFWHPRLATTVSKWAGAERFDVVVCYCSGMYRYTKLPALRDQQVIVDMVDVDSQKWTDCAERAPFFKSLLYRLESRRVRRLEAEIAARATAITFVSSEERELFAANETRVPIRVVGNGVDLNFFSPPKDVPTAEPHTSCFVGVLNYPPNVDGLRWFVDQVWPGVRCEIPTARFLIVGKSPVASVQRLAAVPGVELHANVPDVRPFVARSAVAIAPMRFARGVQNKILEAMAMEKAVVATPQSLEGLVAQPGVDLLEASAPEDWSTTLCSLLRDPTRVARIGSAARHYVEQNHCWNDCLRPFEEFLTPHAPPRAKCRSERSSAPALHSRAANGIST
jgi:sugar transferase (PEP-CTERM/EpsH1 system associated)